MQGVKKEIRCVRPVSSAAAAETLTEQVRERLGNRLEAAGMPSRMNVGDEKIYASTMLPLFYQRRAYLPAWIGNRGPLPRASVLVKEIGKAGEEGLNPDAYHKQALISLMERTGQKQRRNSIDYVRLMVDLDLLLTDAFLLYGAHLLAGRVNPVTMDPEWHANRREADMAGILETAVRSDRIAEALTGLCPKNSGYERLRRALRRYRDIASHGGWPETPAGPKMALEDRSERVATLRKRLQAEGDLGKHPFTRYQGFDEAVEKMGADVMRWIYCGHNPTNNLNFGYGVGDQVRRRVFSSNTVKHSHSGSKASVVGTCKRQ